VDQEQAYYIYILYSSGVDKYYVGYSQDPFKRLEQHLRNDGTKFTGRNSDWELQAVFLCGGGKSEAIKIERFIKRQKSRKLLERMCSEDFIGENNLSQLVRVPHVRD
jgi:putative endonuclease